MTCSTLPASPSTHYFRWLALATSAAVFTTLAVDGVIRASGYGLGCVGHWPLCNGAWFAPLSRLGWLDLAARLAAVFAIPLLGALALAAWRGYRRVRWVVWPAWLALGLFLIRFLLGTLARSVALDVLHFALDLALLTLPVVATVVAFQLSRDARLGDALLHFDAVSRLAGAAALAVFALQAAGSLAAATGARAACPTWPLCGESLWPETTLGLISIGHRFLALVAGLLVFGSVFLAWRRRGQDTRVVVSGSLAAALFLGQALIGAANVLNAFPLHFGSLHVVTAIAIWAALVVFAVLAMQAVRLSPLRSTAAFTFRPARLRPVLADYIVLTKPIVMLLLLVTTAAAMVVAGRDWPPLDLFLWTMLGGALASGGAAALNQVIDHDLDKHMARTSRRPLAQGRVSLAAGLAFGLTLTVLAFYVLAVFVNLAAAFWAMVGSAYYVVAYSVFLKKATPQNIVIGGGAGAIPPLVGWAAVTGTVDAPALFLFALVFFWTPPHFWALSLLKKNDYARAGVPMLPVVFGEPETRRQIVLYTLVLVALSLLFTPAGVAGAVYLLGAALLGLGFLFHALWLWRAPSNKAAWRLYKYSSYFLALMFAVMVADRFIHVAV